MGAFRKFNHTKLVRIDKTKSELLINVKFYQKFGSKYQKSSSKQIFFQQDNCPIHNGKFSKKQFESSNIQVIEWPLLIPDLNPIDNVSGRMSKSISSRLSRLRMSYFLH